MDRLNPTGKKPLILIVEDDGEIRRDLHEVLDHEGFEVRNAAHGLDALNVLRGVRPRLILLDLRMPQMSGEQLLERLRQEPEWAKIPVVIISVLAPPPVMVNGYFRKPFDLPSLLKTVRALTSEDL